MGKKNLLPKIILSAVICIFLLAPWNFFTGSAVICVYAEAEEGTEFKITEFRGGNLSNRFSFYFPWLLGLNSETKEPALYEVFTANQLYTTGNSVSAGLNILPSFDVGKLIPNYLDLDSEVNDALKDNLEQGVTAKAPELTLPSGIKSGVTSLNFSAPYGNLFFSAGYRQLLSLNWEMLTSGADILVEIKQSTGTTGGIDGPVRIKPILNLATNIQVNQYRLRFGGLLPYNLTAEVNLNYYQAEANINGKVTVDALTSLSGQIKEFNTDSHNSLSQSVNAKYKGNGQNFGFTLGHHLYAGRLGINVAYNLPIKVKLEGESNLITHTPLLLHLLLPEDSKLLPTEDFDPTNITKTEEKSEYSNEPVNIEFPSSASVDFIWRTRVLKLSLGYTQYLAPLKYEYKDEKDDFNLTAGVRLDLSTRLISLVTGVILTEEIPLPIFSLGFGIPLSKHWQIDQLIVALPLQLLKTTVSYRF